MILLECDIVGLMALNGDWSAVEINGRQSAVRIALKDPTYANGRLSLGLQVGYKLPFGFVGGFRNLSQAFVLLVQEPDLPAVGHTSLADPDAVLDTDNFEGAPCDDNAAFTFIGGRIGRLIEVGGPPSAPLNQVFMQVCLQNLFSNTLALDIASLAAQIYE